MRWNGEPVQNPKGTVIAFAGNSAPAGYLICNGAAVSRTTYAGLFAVIGTTYGAGDGSTTFNLPDLTDKFIQGSGTAGTVKAAGLPNIEGTFYSSHGEGMIGKETGPFKGTDAGSYGFDSGGNQEHGITVTFDASRSNSIYGNSTTVQPPAICMRYCIKY
jgi:microcystin-dependent protein